MYVGKVKINKELNHVEIATSTQPPTICIKHREIENITKKRLKYYIHKLTVYKETPQGPNQNSHRHTQQEPRDSGL